NDVGEVKRLAGDDRATDHEIWCQRQQRAFLERRHRAVPGGDAHVVAFDQHEARLARIAKVQRALGDGLQHRSYVGWRAGDDAQDLADRRLLIERRLQLVRPFLDLALEARVRLAQPARHPVELVRERLELVARPDFDLLVEIAAGDAARAFVERAYR